MNDKLKLNLKRTIKESRSRFISIMVLIMIGTTVLVGLSVSGRDMRSAAMKVYNEYNTADLMVYSDYGIQDTEKKALANFPGIAETQDVYIAETVMAGTSDSFRLLSKSKSISKYKVIEGRLPKDATEIALDNKYNGTYKIGDRVEFSEASKEIKTLKNTKFKIVGYVLSVQNIHKDNKGVAYAGSGELKGYGVIDETAFNKDWLYGVYIIFDDLKGLDVYGDEYKEKLNRHRNEIDSLLRENAGERLDEMKKPYQEKIDELKMKAALAGPLAAQNIQPKINKLQNQMDKLTRPYYETLGPREYDGNEGAITFETVTKFIDMLGAIFPWILYLVIALVTFANVNRFVNEERGIIGTLKGLGYSEKDIFKKFILFGTLAAFPGLIIGLILGFWVVPHFVYQTYADEIQIFGIDTNFYPSVAILAIILALLNVLIPTVMATTKTLKERTSDLLKKRAPRPGTKVLLEKITLIWSRLSFSNKVTARNLFRYKARMLMTIIGIASATGLLFAGICLQYSVSSIEKRQFSDIEKFDVITVNSPAISEENAEKIEDWHKNNKKISSYINARFNQFYVIGGETNTRQNIHTITTNKTKEFSEYFNLMDCETGAPLRLDDGAIISQKLADSFDVHIGDNFEFFNEKNERNEVKIAGICEMYIGNYLFMSDKIYNEIFNDSYAPNASIVKLKDGSAENIMHFSEEFTKNKGYETAFQEMRALDQIVTITESMGMMVQVLIVIAILMTLIIIYNLTNINMTERIKELSTIKVLGFRDKEVTFYLFKEIFTLSVIAIVIGWLLGLIFNSIVQNVVRVDQVMFYNKLTWEAFPLPMIVVLVTTVLMAFYFHFRFKKINMLKALQAPE